MSAAPEAESRTERTRSEKRRWSEAHTAVKRDVVVSFPQAVREARQLTDDQLAAAAQGCTDLTCVHHGAVNHVRQERRNALGGAR